MGLEGVSYTDKLIECVAPLQWSNDQGIASN